MIDCELAGRFSRVRRVLRISPRQPRKAGENLFNRLTSFPFLPWSRRRAKPGKLSRFFLRVPSLARCSPHGEVLEQSDRTRPPGRDTPHCKDAGLQGLRDRGDHDRQHRTDASHPQGTIRTGTSGCSRSSCACSLECRPRGLKSARYNTRRFLARDICTGTSNHVSLRFGVEPINELIFCVSAGVAGL